MTTLRSPREYHEADFEPLMVVAELDGDIILPRMTPALDGLLAYAVAQEHQLPPIEVQGDEAPTIEVPLARSPCGRYHQASFGIGRVNKSTLQYYHRKWPIEVSQALSSEKTKGIDVAAGRNKSYRLPVERAHLVSDRLWWFAVGHVAEVRNLLTWVTRIGKKRSMGAGKVTAWRVEPVEAWGVGFPVVSPEGEALRPLPSSDPRLVPPMTEGFAVLTYPYHQAWREQWLALPFDALRGAQT
jgi:hypothetical protein